MDDFEKAFDAKILTIRKRTGAYLYWLHPPMRCVGMRGPMPVFVQTGRALFDVAGWLPVKGEFYPEKLSLPSPSVVNLSVGIELKRNKDSHPSIRIVGDDGTGSGMQAHQLEALAAVHRDGGIARILWNNGGDIRFLDGEQIAQAYFAYGVSVAAERLGKNVAKGARSIPWKNFIKVDFHDHPENIILPDFREPTLSETLQKKRRDTANKMKKVDDGTEAAKVFEESYIAEPDSPSAFDAGDDD